ncbi:MAG: hypothetical protein PHQ42_00120 [Patescibacteria group bacterium]|nr:hypothetical protein [Patescibacteria group bacterium]
MKTVTVALSVAIFMALGVCLAFGDINIVVRADLSKIKISEGWKPSKEIEFKDGKAVWEEYGDFYFAFYSEKALRVLVESDSIYVVLAPRRKEIKPAFGNLYFVTRNILWGVGEEYGLNSEIYYVWPVEFERQNMNLKDEKGMLYHEGLAPFGDYAIDEIKNYGRKITKDSFKIFASGN